MQNFLDQLRDNISIVDVVQEKVSLTKKGREYMGLCPFHGEKTPSFYVNPAKGFYYCFGCQSKGNIFTFYQEVYKMTFIEAVENLAQKAGLSIPAKLNLSEAFKEDNKKNNLISICESANDYFSQNLSSQEGKQALDYLRNRGLKKETIDYFNLGFAFNSSKPLWDIIEKNGYYDEDILEIGLKNHNQKGDIYDFFRNRIIFPIKDAFGKTIAFGGRGMGDEIPKYLNTKESYIFHKKNTLYNLNLALQNLKNNSLIVVEGYMDVIALFNNGFKTAVAGLGTSVTLEHLKLINKYDKSPIFCLDGDSAGIKATERVTELYLSMFEIGMNPRFVMLEDSQDPDSYVLKNGKEKFQELLKEAKSLSEILWGIEAKDLNLSLPEVSMMVLRELEKKISKIKDSQLRSKYLSFFKNKLYNYGRNNSFILHESNAYNHKSVETTEISKKKVNYISERDGILIACVLLYPEILYDVEEKLGLCSFKDIKLEKLRLILLENIHFSDGDMSSFLSNSQEECNYVLNMSMVKPKLQSLLSAEIAKSIFNDSYNLILIENLEIAKKETLSDIKSLGQQLSEIRVHNEQNTQNKEQKNIENKIQILMAQQIEISKHINALKQTKLD
jgi:DNA primase